MWDVTFQNGLLSTWILINYCTMYSTYRQTLSFRPQNHNLKQEYSMYGKERAKEQSFIRKH